MVRARSLAGRSFARVAVVAAAWVLVAGAARPGPEEIAAAAVPDVLASPAVVGTVEFPHGMHVDDLGFACADCHHETNAARLRMPHAEYFEDFWIDCRICHREDEASLEPRSCAACHHAAPADIADQTLSAKVVIHKSCWACHESGRGREASRNCGFCHQREGETAP